MPDTGTEQTQADTTKVTEPVKPVFSDEQQTRVNDLIREAQGRAAKELRAENTRLAEEVRLLKEKAPETKVGETVPPPDFKAEVERIKREFQNEAKLLKQEAKKEADEAAVLREKDKRRDKADAIRGAMDATGVEFVSREAATTLSEKNVVWDEDRKRFVIHDVNGNLKFNTSLEPLDLNEFYRTFANDNPWLVKAQVRGGAGSKESSTAGSGKYNLEDIFGPKSKPALAQKLASENILEYRRMKVLAKEQGLV